MEPRDEDDHAHPEVRGEPAAHTHGHEHFGPADVSLMATSQGVRVTWITLGLLALTASAQLAVVALSGSVSLIADTIHNFTDALTAIPLLIAFRLARRPPNRRYTYGYHRAEDVAGVVIVLLIAASAVVAAIEATRHLVHPQPLRQVPWVLAAGIAGFLGNEVVSVYRIRVGKRIGSTALVADGLHARTDGLTSLGVVVSAAAALAGFDRADPAIGLAITAVILLTLWSAAKSVLHRMLDGTDEQTVTLIEAVAATVPGVEHVGDARARWTGHQLRAELSIDVDPSVSVEAGHAIAELVRGALLHGVPRLAEASVHVDPHEHDPHSR
ncbi:MAG: cation diffusion facilitator family transporter [Actinomycetota bacterium]